VLGYVTALLLAVPELSVGVVLAGDEAELSASRALASELNAIERTYDLGRQVAACQRRYQSRAACVCAAPLPDEAKHLLLLSAPSLTGGLRAADLRYLDRRSCQLLARASEVVSERELRGWAVKKGAELTRRAAPKSGKPSWRTFLEPEARAESIPKSEPVRAPSKLSESETSPAQSIRKPLRVEPLPELTKEHVRAALGPLRGRLAECSRRHFAPGVSLLMSITIGTDGWLSELKCTPARCQPELQQCLERELSGPRFPPHLGPPFTTNVRL
jgi:hypothetical protein